MHYAFCFACDLRACWAQVLHGAPYVKDDCQWSSDEMREIEMRSERSLRGRLFLQFVGREHTGYYVPLP